MIKFHVSFKWKSHTGTLRIVRSVEYMIEWGQVSRENNVKEVDSWCVRDDSNIIHGCHAKTNHCRLRDSLQHMHTDRQECICIYSVQKLQSYILKPAGVADKHSASWTDMCHCQLSTWSTLHHQISKCFIYLYLSMFGMLKHETRARNHLS